MFTTIEKHIDREYDEHDRMRVARVYNYMFFYDEEELKYKFYVKIVHIVDPENNPWDINDHSELFCYFGIPDKNFKYKPQIDSTRKLASLSHVNIRKYYDIDAGQIIEYIKKKRNNEKYENKVFKINKEELRRFIDYAIAIETEKPKSLLDVDLLYYLNELLR